jgi:hypothetical protein
MINKTYIETIGNQKLYWVDELEIRNSSESGEEFSNYGMPEDFPNMIPENEIWFSNRIKQIEYPFLKDEALNRIKYENQGMNPNDAYDKAIQEAKSERIKYLKTLLSHPENTNKKAFTDIYIKRLKSNMTKLNVFLVNGTAVRDYYKTDFVEGGHGYVYDFVPINEIWIEDEVPMNERILILLHELYERYLMKYKGFDYLKAHNAASKLEWKYRKILYGRTDNSTT